MTHMHNPPHPGETIREDILPALGLTVTEAAKQLGVTRATLSRVINEKAAISPEMALRLEGWLGVETVDGLTYGSVSRPPMASGRHEKPVCPRYSGPH